MAPLLGVGALALAGVHAAAWSAQAIGIGALIGGLTGTTYGIGTRTFKAAAKPLNWAYDKATSQIDDTLAAPQLNQRVSPSAPDKVTAEEVSAMNERMARAGNSKSFAQTIANQQMQAAPATTRV